MAISTVDDVSPARKILARARRRRPTRPRRRRPRRLAPPTVPRTRPPYHHSRRTSRVSRRRRQKHAHHPHRLARTSRARRRCSRQISARTTTRLRVGIIVIILVVRAARTRARVASRARERLEPRARGVVVRERRARRERARHGRCECAGRSSHRRALDEWRDETRARAIATLAWATMACGTVDGAEGRRGTSTRADGTFFDAGARGWLKRVGEETTTTTGVNAGELVVVARAAVGLTSPSVDAGAIDARDDVVRTVLDEERRFFAAGDDDETRRRRFLTLSADESVWRTGEVEFSAIEGVVARDVSFDGSRSRTTLRETAKAIARGGRSRNSETRELFDRRVCFGEEVVKRLEKSDVDASARVKGFVERELKCFEEGVEAFASDRGGDEPKFAYVALEGATYASKSLARRATSLSGAPRRRRRRSRESWLRWRKRTALSWRARVGEPRPRAFDARLRAQAPRHRSSSFALGEFDVERRERRCSRRSLHAQGRRLGRGYHFHRRRRCRRLGHHGHAATKGAVPLHRDSGREARLGLKLTVII